MKEIIETETEVDTTIHCSQCFGRVDNGHCSECGGVLFELADYRNGDKIFCYTETDAHFCSKECVEAFKLKEAEK